MAYRAVAAILFIPVFSAAFLCQAAPQDRDRSETPSSASTPSSPQMEPQGSNASQGQTGGILGTVTAVNGDLVPGATVVLEGSNHARTMVTNDRGFFQLDDLGPGIAYHVTVRATGFADWNSPAIILNPGQFLILKDCTLKIAAVKTTVSVGYDTAEIAAEQVKVEEQQRVLGIIPNFYVVYDHNAAPLTTKLKFKLALRTSIDPITLFGVAMFAGIDQAADRPKYEQGAKGFGERLGAGYLDGFSDIMVGGAILPSLLHQDPRYFYQGTGTKTSRTLHALSNPFICRGDNGRQQPNYSSIGGDLAAAALTNAYYPPENRGAWPVFESVLIDTGERMAASLAQEFLFRKLTKTKKNK